MKLSRCRTSFALATAIAWLIAAQATAADPLESEKPAAGPKVRVLVAYHSRRGTTETMARGVAEGARRAGGVEVLLKRVEDVTKADLQSARGIILGSPTYYANIPGAMKTVIDDWSWKMKVDFTDKVGEWTTNLARIERAGERVAIWGAGSKGVTFLNTVGGGQNVVCAVDINTRKQGRFVPGTGQEVVGPERLASLGVDLVLVMNPLYIDEIAETLEGLGVSARIEHV